MEQEAGIGYESLRACGPPAGGGPVNLSFMAEKAFYDNNLVKLFLLMALMLKLYLKKTAKLNTLIGTV